MRKNRITLIAIKKALEIAEFDAHIVYASEFISAPFKKAISVRLNDERIGYIYLDRDGDLVIRDNHGTTHIVCVFDVNSTFFRLGLLVNELRCWSELSQLFPTI